MRSIINNTIHSFAVWKVYRQVHAYFIIHAYFKDSCSYLCYDIWHSPSFAFPCHTRKLLNNNHQYMLIWVQIWWYMLLIVIGIWQNTIIISNTCIIKSCISIELKIDNVCTYKFSDIKRYQKYKHWEWSKHDNSFLVKKQSNTLE